MTSDKVVTCSLCGTQKPVSEYYAKTKICKECTKARRKEYYRANKEKVLGSCKKYRQEHLEMKRAKDREYYYKNRERLKKVFIEYYGKNRNKMLVNFKSNYNSNKEEYKARVSRYYENNKENIKPKIRAYRKTPKGRLVHLSNHHKRKAQKLNTANEKLSKYISELTSGKFFCYWCGAELTGKEFHIDHIYPLSKGGTHTRDNICIACPKCNLKKSNKMPFEFQKELSRKGQLKLF